MNHTLNHVLSSMYQINAMRSMIWGQCNHRRYHGLTDMRAWVGLAVGGWALFGRRTAQRRDQTMERMNWDEDMTIRKSFHEDNKTIICTWGHVAKSRCSSVVRITWLGACEWWGYPAISEKLKIRSQLWEIGITFWISEIITTLRVITREGWSVRCIPPMWHPRWYSGRSLAAWSQGRKIRMDDIIVSQ